MNGVINICKQNGWTSNDAVVKLKGILKQKQIGHTGTLDPGAAGVLPVCVGKATRLFDYLTQMHKTYIAEICFGAETDTQDSYGVVTRCADTTFTQEALSKELARITGTLLQTPPMYSAIKQNGKKLYELARAGESTEIKQREVFVESIEQLTPLKNNRCLLKIECGKGTYIRTLCHDIGRSLGSAAHMSFLLRKSAGGLNITNTYTIQEINTMAKEGDYSFLIPIDKVIEYMPAIHFSEEAFKALKNGNPISVQYALNAERGRNDAVRIYCKGIFFGIGQKQDDVYKIKCMLYDEVENETVRQSGVGDV